jgi:nucleotide-binding universal stress UspA family protein
MEVGAMTMMLVAVDDSSFTENVALKAARLALALNSEVTVFHLAAHAVDFRSSDADAESAEQAGKIVDSALQVIRANGVGSTVARVDRGLAGEEARAILDVAREIDAEFIVMGHRGHGQAGRPARRQRGTQGNQLGRPFGADRPLTSCVTLGKQASTSPRLRQPTKWRPEVWRGSPLRPIQSPPSFAGRDTRRTCVDE